jgi:transposase
MSKTSPHPDWATEFRKPGTELRLIKGHYYLYQVSSKYDPVTKKSKKITGKLLGTISKEYGFIQSDKNLLRLKADQTPKIIYSREYGASKYVFDSNNDIIEKLKNFFPEFWLEIALMAFFRLVYQSPIKNLQLHYSHSYISFSNPKAHIQEKKISLMLRTLGRDRSSIVGLMRTFNNIGDYILIDLTNVTCKSRNISMAHKGYNSHRDYDPQVNLMLIFSATLREPVFYKVVPGNIREVKSFILTLKESGIQEAVLIVDKGFYSEKNIRELNENELNFILPLRRNNTMINYKPASLSNRKGFQGYFKYDKRYVWFYKKKIGKMQLIVFLDEELKAREEKDYLDRIDSHPESYSFIEFKENIPAMGTITLLTSQKDKTAEDIFKAYKSRCEIEQMIDVMKNNIEADKTYMHDDDALQGWFFVNFIALIWHYRIYKLLSDNNLLSKFSVKDFLTMLLEIKKVSIDHKWYICEINSKIEELLKKLKLSIT